MRFPDPLVRGTLIKRDKRFLVAVKLDDGRNVIAHTNNTGSMKGCNTPGARVWLSPANDPKRKLKWTLELVESDPPAPTTPVGVNTLAANRIVGEALDAGAVPALRGHDWVKREAKSAPGSRIDFLLGKGDMKAPRARTWVEVKNVSMVEKNRALFPDAPTERGRKHLAELARLVAEGDRAAMFYLTQRADAKSFGPAEVIDPLYAEALREVHAAGVEILAYRCDVSPRGIELGRRLRIVL